MGAIRARWRGAVLACLVACAAGGLSGCVERKLLVRVDPPGAVVYLDGRFEGPTDAEGELEVPFDFYGTRTLVLRHPGHAPLETTVELSPPWWQLFPLDLFTDVLWPGTIEDTHQTERLVLKRRPGPRPADAVQGDAEAFRAGQERRW